MVGRQTSFQLSTQSSDPGVWKRVLAKTFEQMEGGGTRETRMD